MNVLMPQFGETVTEGTIANWHKQVGDHVEVDEILLDVETDKVSMEIPAPAAGTLTEIRVEAGATVDVGTVLAVIGSADAASDESPAEKQKAEEPTPSASPAPAAPSAPAEKAPAKEASASEPSGRASAAPAAAPRDNQQRLSPAVRRLVAENELDVSTIDGTGRNGRVTRRDVLEHIADGGALTPAPAATASAPAAPASAGTSARQTAASQAPGPSPARSAPSTQPASPAPNLEGGRVPFNRIRKLTADHMVRSKATSPHVLQAVEVDFSNVDRVRKAVKESFKAENGFSLTYLPFIAHAVCRALADFPHANASVDGDSLVLHEHVNLGIAIDLGANGLVAPVIKAAENLSITNLAGEISDLAKRSRANQLTPDDLSGGTYTLSNSGTFGTLITAPIINQPQVAILSTDGVRKKPVVIESPEGDSIGIRPVGILAQSFDHRAIDGAYSAAFLDRIRRLLEGNNWFREL